MLELTAKELLYASAQLGAQTFFGLPDPFYGMDDGEISRELVEIQLSLTQKGYASMGFDAAFSLTGKASELISICAHCDQYITADFHSPDGQDIRLLFYILDGKAAELLEDDEKLLLRPMEWDAIAGYIWDKMEWPRQESVFPDDADDTMLDEDEDSTPDEDEGSMPDEDEDSMPYVDGSHMPDEVGGCISYACLSEVSMLAQNNPSGAVELLKSEGYSEAFAEILLDGFQKKAGYYAICVSDLLFRTMDHMICIRAKAGSVAITPVEDDGDSELWSFIPFDGDEARDILTYICSPIEADEGEDDE